MKWKFINKQSSSTTRYTATEYYGMLILPYEIIHIWSPWKLSNFHEPSPFTCPFMCKIILPPAHWSWTSNFTQTCPHYSHFYYSFCKQPVLFVQLENIHKLWNNNCTVHLNPMEQQLHCHCACECTKSKQKQNQVMSHSKQPQVLLFNLAHK